MVVNNILFKTQLNYQIQANSADNEDISLSIDDISDIDLHKCHFNEFQKVLSYLRDTNSDLDYSDASIEAIKPAPFSESEMYNFVELTDFARHTSITIGNMALFSELQKVSKAIEMFNNMTRQEESRRAGVVLPFEDYDSYDIKDTPATTEELGSYVISSGNFESVRITATFHESSTLVRPIISIRTFSLNTNSYAPNIDLINLDTIFKPNATLMETFAYMSYSDHQKNLFNHSFDKLMSSGAFDITSIEDLYTKHYDLSLFDNE